MEVELDEASLREKVKPLNLQSSFPASTKESKRSDFVRSNAWSLRLFLCASSQTPNWMIAPGKVGSNEKEVKNEKTVM